MDLNNHREIKMKRKIAVIVGSLRKESFNRKIAKILMELAPDSLEMKFVEIGKLPFYNEDEETSTPPPAWTEFREAVKACDGVLFVTPEYNRSVPGVMKNAIDVGSRPYGKSIWDAKPSAVISASVGAIGGFGANHHLRQSLVTLNVPCMAGPETYISNVGKLFDEKGNLTNEDTRKILGKFISAYAQWVEKNAA